MTVFTRVKGSVLIFIFIFVVAATLRLWQLGKVPLSMSDDEIRLVYNSYSIWQTGKDINGNMLPLAFIVSGYAFNPVPIYLTSPFVGLIGLNMFTSRLPFALSGILTIMLLFILANKLLKNKTIAAFSSLALSFSAWYLQLSRFAYEGSLALFFYVLGILIFVVTKKSNFIGTLLAMLIFFIGFYSYSGTKLIFLPVIAILVWYKYKELNYRQLIIIALFIVFTFASFAFLGKTQNATEYGGKQFFFQDLAVSEAVELERRDSLSPEFLKRLYHNKLTYLSKIFIDRYSYAFSPQYLFLSQEANGIFSLWFRGQMYYIELPLLILGLFYLFVKKRRELILLLSFLLIAPIPSGLGPEPTTYTIRSSFMLPWLMILVGAGVYSFYSFIKDKNIRIGVYLFLSIAYIYLIGGYLNQYYFEWIRYGAKYYAKGTQDIVGLISKEKTSKTSIIIASADINTFLHYAFYNKLSPDIVQKAIRSKPIRIDNITFQRDCIDDEKKNLWDLLPANSLYISKPQCHRNTKGGYIIKTYDNKEDEWKVFKR